MCKSYKYKQVLFEKTFNFIVKFLEKEPIGSNNKLKALTVFCSFIGTEGVDVFLLMDKFKKY